MAPCILFRRTEWGLYFQECTSLKNAEFFLRSVRNTRPLYGKEVLGEEGLVVMDTSRALAAYQELCSHDL